MHALFECDVLMQLVMSYFQDKQLSIWLSDPNSEWFLRMIKWAPGHLPESIRNAYQMGDVAKIKKTSFTTVVPMNEWHMKTWKFFADNDLTTLREHIEGVSFIKNPEKLVQILPFFKLEHASCETKQILLCSTIETLELNPFMKLYAEFKLECSQPLLCMIVEKEIGS